MELSKTPRWFYLLVAVLGLLVLVLGAWWLYLLTVLAAMLGPTQSKVGNMVKWEGSTFLAPIVLCGLGPALLYWRDLKKTRALQALFASLTHELKTPLASMRLQAEVIRDLIADESHDHGQLTSLTSRLIQDTSKFEHELDKGLQLSRLEGHGPLTLVSVELARFIRKTATKQVVAVAVQGTGTVLADEMALAMIFRNLLENTQRHSKSLRATISLEARGDHVLCTYDDHGADFTGNRGQLGQLFYKHDSKKGSGIGLYLVKQLMLAQQGHMSFSETGPLLFKLNFKAPTGEAP